MWKQLRVTLFLSGLLLGGCMGQENKTREPAVAGSFYPAEPAALGKMVDGFISQAGPAKDAGEVVGLISPHAGYVYSGPVAAYAYAQIAGKDIERVVVIAPSHYQSFSGVSIYSGDQYKTPLGSIPVDTEFAQKLALLSSQFRLSGDGHTFRNPAGQGEHAIEVQLPFLQRTLKNFKLVPIVMGQPRSVEELYDTPRALGVALARLITDRRTLLVASSDLSHYHGYNEANVMDHKLADAIRDWDFMSISRNLGNRQWEACGGFPIIAVMIASQRLGANQARILKQANSGDTSGPRDSVVGYLAAAFVKDSVQRKSEDYSLGANEQAHLLSIARDSVKAAVVNRTELACTDGGFPTLSQDRGAFVTLTRGGKLRGCVGYTAPVKPLYEAVRDVAAYAAIHDSRFLPVTASELDSLDYEVSVLSPLRRIASIDEIEVGKHGLLIRKGSYEGLLLPQVPTENNWDKLTFLQNLCYKAGLPPNAWKDEDADIFSFTAYVFGTKK